MLITKQIEFDMGHRIPNHHSKCKNFHGHRYKVICAVEGNLVDDAGKSEEGMVMDFGDLKSIMMTLVHDRLDHGFMICDKDPYAVTFGRWHAEDQQKIIMVDFIPTAENLAIYIFNIMYRDLINCGMKLRYVEVWETPTSMAHYDGCDSF